MENIYDGSLDIENDDVLNDLDGNFSSVFQELVERTTAQELQGRNPSTSSSNSENSKIEENSRVGQNANETNSALVQRNLELHLSPEAQKKIQDILSEVRQLSEKEKLLLYLKLPTKTGGSADESQPIQLSNTRQEQTQAFQWIRTNLEECESSYTLPKHEVYDDYKAYCESLGANRTLSAPDFGKIIKCVFPRVKARRLGTRGNSKYCYSGLRKKIITESPSLPSLKGGKGEVNNNESSNQSNEITEDQTLSAACNLVCEWANKLLGRVFSTLLDLARFLVGGSYVSTKSMAAFVVMSATESKVRKMSEKLQLWSTPPSATETKTASEGKSSPLRHAASSEHNSLNSKPKMTSSNHKPTTPIKSERLNSLTGIQIVTTTSDVPKTPNKLMSPPICPPPKPHLTPKTSPLATSSPSYASPVMMPNRGKANHVMQGGERSFPQMDSNGVNIHSMQGVPQIHVTKPVEQQKHRQTLIARAPVMLRRSDSCPYPSQSPRATRQIAPNQVAANLSPNPSIDISRNENWQSPLGSPCPTLPGDIHKFKQMTSSNQMPAIQQVMTTPTNKQPLQRCQSVPVPYTSPQGEVYHPLTPQLGALPNSPGGYQSPSYSQLKDTRKKFMGNEISSSARRNLMPYLTGSEQKAVVSKKNEGPEIQTAELGNHSNELKNHSTELGNHSISGGLNNQISVNIETGRKIADVNNRISSSNTIGNPSNAGMFNNGIGDRTMGSPSVVNLGNNGQQVKQSINTMTGPASLATVDNLIDPLFSLGDVSTSSGNGLGEMDGLDDVTTMDLLRSLNSGNNIWANEWNSNGMQLMESS